jgi:hypothetical protein
MPAFNPQPGQEAPDTVVEALAQLEADGFTESFRISQGNLHCDSKSEVQPIEFAVVDRFYRFEGASDPEDEAIVFGVTNPATGTRGTLVSGYGPSADPEEMDSLIILQQRAADAS